MSVANIHDAYLNLQKDRDSYVSIVNDLLDKLDLQFNDWLKKNLADTPLLFSPETELYLKNTHEFFTELQQQQGCFAIVFTLCIYLEGNESYNVELPAMLRLDCQTCLSITTEYGDISFDAYNRDDTALEELYEAFYRSLPYNPLAES